MARNFRCRAGEIDLIMQDDDVVVFVEVRRRRHRQFGGAAASVDARKQRKLIRTAAIFLSRHSELGNRPVRFDVLGIDGDRDERQRIEWITDAFRPGDSG